MRDFIASGECAIRAEMWDIFSRLSFRRGVVFFCGAAEMLLKSGGGIFYIQTNAALSGRVRVGRFAPHVAEFFKEALMRGVFLLVLTFISAAQDTAL